MADASGSPACEICGPGRRPRQGHSAHRFRDREPVILLAHEPDYADHVARRGAADLVLSGHTHGGQVRIPFLPPLFLPPLGRKYIEGQFRIGGLQLYVNRGIGAVGIPFRFNVPPEITVITLA